MNKNNITKFVKLIESINNSIKDMAELYYQDLKNDPKNEAVYVAKTPFTRTMLRRLEAIAKDSVMPEAFLIGNATAYRLIATMSTEQQYKCINEKMRIVAEDGSFWSKSFEDLSPRQMNMVYDQRAKTFRSDSAQREWLKDNPVVKVSRAGKLKPVEEVVNQDEKPKRPTKSSLIRSLKSLHPTAKDLAFLGDAATLMAAAQMVLSEKVK